MNTGTIPFGTAATGCVDAVTYAARKENALAGAEAKQDFLSHLLKETEKKCPYGYLARDGIIEYNGVKFFCDTEHNSINLGDTSDPSKVLRINLPSGGSLCVNVDNIGSLSKAVGMFSPEDLNAIMRAIYEYNQCRSKVNEIEEETQDLWTKPQTQRN